MDKTELFIKNLFADRFKIELRKIPEPGDKQTPDFEMIANGERVAVLEVKNLEAVDPSKAKGWSKDGFFSTRKDNGPARVARCIHKACGQLSEYQEPKILVLVSDGDVDVLDLEEAVRGFLDYGDGDFVLRNTASRKIAQGDIRDEKGKIDLYVWVNRHLFGDPFILEMPALQKPRQRIIKDENLVQFRVTTPAGEALVNSFQGLVK